VGFQRDEPRRNVGTIITHTVVSRRKVGIPTEASGHPVSPFAKSGTGIRAATL